jgi:hypothetical protein
MALDTTTDIHGAEYEVSKVSEVMLALWEETGNDQAALYKRYTQWAVTDVLDLQVNPTETIH